MMEQVFGKKHSMDAAFSLTSDSMIFYKTTPSHNICPQQHDVLSLIFERSIERGTVQMRQSSFGRMAWKIIIVILTIVSFLSSITCCCWKIYHYYKILHILVALMLLIRSMLLLTINVTAVPCRTTSRAHFYCESFSFVIAVWHHASTHECQSAHWTGGGGGGERRHLCPAGRRGCYYYYRSLVRYRSLIFLLVLFCVCEYIIIIITISS